MTRARHDGMPVAAMLGGRLNEDGPPKRAVETI
jgi:hypothetical protein